MKINENMKVFEIFKVKTLNLEDVYCYVNEKIAKTIKIGELTKFFCKTLDIFFKRDRIICVGRIKSLSNILQIFYKEIVANDEYRNCKKSHRSLRWT